MVSKKKFVNLLDYEHIRSAIAHYGFCATIEVSNGSYKKKKKKQFERSKDFLSALAVGMPSKGLSVMQGLAIIKHANSAKKKDLDFIIGISQLDNSTLRGVGFDALNGPYLGLGAKKALEHFLQVSEEESKAMYYLMDEDDGTYAGEIKGVLLEMYVKKLIDMGFGSSWRRIFSRVEFYGETHQIGETDIVVVSDEVNFRAALNRVKCLDHIKVY